VDTNTTGTGCKIAWGVLAAVDAVALAYVIWNVPWGLLNTSRVQGEYAWLVKPFSVGLDLLWNGTAAAFAVAVGYAIARELRGGWRAPRGAAVAASIPLLLGIVAAAWAAYHELSRLLAVTLLPDRVVVFDALAYANAQGETTGARIAWIAAAAYLGEKYLLRWWNVRWPPSIVALAMIAWPYLVALNGEAREKEWTQAQQWRSIGDGKTWLQALQACNAIGPGWRLPRPKELPLYVASEPEALHGARGKLWTSVTSEWGRAAVVVELQPRLTGSWRSNETPHRDQSPCELDANRRSTATDWFAALRPKLCASGFLSPAMFVTTEQLIAYPRGMRATPSGNEYIVTETTAGTVCMKPGGGDLPNSRRAFPKQEEYPDAAAFLERMRAVCNPRRPGSDAAACAAFGSQEPATKATAG
jgi:hypothetical protein